MRSFNSIRPQDIAIMLKKLVSPELSQKDLATLLNVSQSEVSQGTHRLKTIGLFNEKGHCKLEAVYEFVVHALKYICPVEVGPVTIGVPTAYAKPGFKFVRYDSNDIYVWPHPNGKSKGTSIIPFLPSIPDVCLKDDKTYALLSLIEMIRVGKAREQKLAADELKNLIMDAK